MFDFGSMTPLLTHVIAVAIGAVLHYLFTTAGE